MDAFIADYVQQAKELKALGFDIVSIYACYRNQPMPPHAHYKNMVRSYWQRQPLFESLTGVRCTAIDPDGVRYIDRDDTEKKVFSDSVLLCTGAASNADTAEALIGSAPQIAFIGDVNQFGNVQKAVREGWAAAMNIR